MTNSSKLLVEIKTLGDREFSIYDLPKMPNVGMLLLKFYRAGILARTEKRKPDGGNLVWHYRLAPQRMVYANPWAVVYPEFFNLPDFRIIEMRRVCAPI